MDNKKELITAVEKVRSYCHNQENCLDCIFYDIDLDCCNIQGIPDEWIYSRFSQDEVKLAKILKKYVRSYCHNQENCLDCIFYDIDLDCCNIQGIPDEWIYSRFSQDEVKLAKILKKYGVCRIARKGPVAYWGTKDGFGGYFPKGMFENMGETEEVSIDEVNR